jgi:hypothetical protein
MSITWLIYFSILPIAGGLLAASGFIMARKPDAKKYLDMLAPYSGFIGIGMFVDGVINIPFWLSNGLGSGYFTGLSKIMILLLVPTLVLTGFLLGFGLAAKYIFKGGGNQAAQEKAGKMQAKLANFAAPLGFVTIIAGLLFMLFWLRIIN